MERLDSRHYRAILDFLGELYTPTGIREFPDRLVENLQKLIPCDWTFCGEMDPDQRTSVHSASPAECFTEEISQKLWVPVMHEHPVLMHARRSGDLRAYRISDFLSQREFHRTPLYNEFYRRLGLEDALCKAIHVEDSVVIGCSFQRRKRFTEEECLMFELIGIHVVQAWRNAHAMTNVLQQAEAMSQAVEALGCGVVVLHSDGRVRSMTSRVRSILEAFFGNRQASHHHLPAMITGWVRERKKQFPANDVSKPLLPLVMQRGESQLEVRLLSDYARDLLLLQVKPRATKAGRREDLHLTAREMDVLEWVARGKTNEEIGLILGASHRTVQKHLEHIFAKLGVETRTAAAIMLQGDSGWDQTAS